MMVPTIHLNGTSPERLIDDLCEACSALRLAYEAIKRCAPNGRDYYLQGPAALSQATDEHMGRLKAVDAITGDIESLIEKIDAQRGVSQCV